MSSEIVRQFENALKTVEKDTQSFNDFVNNDKTTNGGDVQRTAADGTTVSTFKNLDFVIDRDITQAGVSAISKAQTGFDAIKTAAETAKTAAEAAKTAAETAKTGAETAKTGAEAARTQLSNLLTVPVASDVDKILKVEEKPANSGNYGYGFGHSESHVIALTLKKDGGDFDLILHQGFGANQEIKATDYLWYDIFSTGVTVDIDGSQLKIVV